MCKKLLLVCLIQVTLARRIPDTRRHIQSPFKPVRDFYVRNPDSEFYEVRRQVTQHRNDDSTERAPYIDGGRENHDLQHNSRRVDHIRDKVFQTGGEPAAYYEIQRNNQGPELRNNDFSPENSNQNRHGILGNGQNKDRPINNSEISKERQHYEVNKNRANSRNHELGNRNRQERPKTNVDKTPNVPNINTTPEIQYVVRNIESGQGSQGIRTNAGQGDNPKKNSEPIDQSVTNTGNRGAHKTEDDNLSEVNHKNVNNAGKITFLDVDNPRPNQIKTTTDNGFKYNQKTEGEEGAGNETDRGTSSTSLPVKPSTDKSSGGLDDRTAIDGDKCPDGQAKVKGVCMTED